MRVAGPVSVGTLLSCSAGPECAPPGNPVMAPALLPLPTAGVSLRPEPSGHLVPPAGSSSAPCFP